MPSLHLKGLPSRHPWDGPTGLFRPQDPLAQGQKGLSHHPVQHVGAAPNSHQAQPQHRVAIDQHLSRICLPLHQVNDAFVDEADAKGEGGELGREGRFQPV